MTATPSRVLGPGHTHSRVAAHRARPATAAVRRRAGGSPLAVCRVLGDAVSMYAPTGTHTGPGQPPSVGLSLGLQLGPGVSWGTAGCSGNSVPVRPQTPKSNSPSPPAPSSAARRVRAGAGPDRAPHTSRCAGTRLSPPGRAHAHAPRGARPGQAGAPCWPWSGGCCSRWCSSQGTCDGACPVPSPTAGIGAAKT